ncbi:hypothetical protein GUITHDRAFT_158768 [Guillardia theta CCMP2712]|uniref:Uncharacterized protein n=1 Tax=Guillardia theta (strain CCMP2712) TaxID=905079 RepID=L1IFS2_GUITC|nr:hypothetical protein GUITHDRAFT_158768 [Guillardia theta CCMP2712]EKX35088.1 hypothetical protein GUITHDRAFT_158768 [Guillardia theta CCMP2712]|eukprot:XP_005822068.1 hypothetical protein GUITHDRAFT_158768 [Guillardia theta CCMP2712]
MVTGGVMRKYQIEGMMWICSLYENGLNGILADEMGLGKTIQSVSFLAHLYSMGVKGPFMIVAPLSTVTNWQREFARWTPSIETVLYHGSKEERRALREQIGFENKVKHPPSKSFPVIITSFEVAMNDAKKLANLNWKYLIVDEGHRLKNKDCRLLRELKSLNSDNRLLLSGTPLQNNLTELWSLLHFILPDIFQDLATFQTWFDFDEELHAEKGTARIIEEESKNKTVSKLHAILDPFLLRRLKTDVLINLPKKREYILMAPLTESQEKINKSIADKSLDSFLSEQITEFEVTDGNWERQGAVNNKAMSLMNVLMQMRKNCNHPYLFTAPFDSLGNIVVDERLVKSAGKLQLLDRMLTILRKNGHKVLIFSQMTKMLDLLEDYLELRGWPSHRIDGTVNWKDRQSLMDDYNSPTSNSFVFLLSTRSGGLGINLTTADTVIIYDGDFNPQQDLQAMDRCHRIGQTKPVSVFRLITVQSVESKIFERASNKRKLELVAIARKRFKVKNLTEIRQSISSTELVELLKPKVTVK